MSDIKFGDEKITIEALKEKTGVSGYLYHSLTTVCWN